MEKTTTAAENAASSTDLNLTSTEVKEISAMGNGFAQTFIGNVGEVVIKFKNFTRQTKYFIFSVTETDSAGMPLSEKELAAAQPYKGSTTVAASAANMPVSDAEMDEIEKTLAAENPE